MKIERRGRIAENDTPILQYTQEFKEYTGETFTWIWNKTKHSNGPLSVEIKSPEWATFDKKEAQLSALRNKYEPKKNERKTRITKTDKEVIEILEKELCEIFYNHYPEDRPKIRKPRKIK
jgi:hypothetical protein